MAITDILTSDDAEIVEIKRGAAFEFEVELSTGQDEPIVLALENSTAQVKRLNDELKTEMTIESGDDPGVYVLASNEDTSGWELEIMAVDIRTVINGKVTYSDTGYISLVKQITTPDAPSEEL